jgi:hypothetical protein
LKQILGDLGSNALDIIANCSAEVIKIENPTIGDDTRAWGPPFAKPLPKYATSDYRGESAYFLSVLPVTVKLIKGQSEQEVCGFEFQAFGITCPVE